METLTGRGVLVCSYWTDGDSPVGDLRPCLGVRGICAEVPRGWFFWPKLAGLHAI